MRQRAELHSAHGRRIGFASVQLLIGYTAEYLLGNLELFGRIGLDNDETAAFVRIAANRIAVVSIVFAHD